PPHDRGTTMTPHRPITRIILVAVAMTLTGCILSGAGDETNETEIPMADRPPMEEILDTYEQMQLEIVQALTADPGGLTWEPADNDGGLGRALCPESGPDAETATLPSAWARGAYEGAARTRASEVVTEIAGQH